MQHAYCFTLHLFRTHTHSVRTLTQTQQTSAHTHAHGLITLTDAECILMFKIKQTEMNSVFNVMCDTAAAAAQADSAGCVSG